MILLLWTLSFFLCKFFLCVFQFLFSLSFRAGVCGLWVPGVAQLEAKKKRDQFSFSLDGSFSPFLFFSFRAYLSAVQLKKQKPKISLFLFRFFLFPLVSFIHTHFAQLNHAPSRLNWIEAMRRRLNKRKHSVGI